jgi:hypothetical protein
MNISRWYNHRSKYGSRQKSRIGAGLNSRCFFSPWRGPLLMLRCTSGGSRHRLISGNPFGLRRWSELFRCEEEAKRSRAAKAICTET